MTRTRTQRFLRLAAAAGALLLCAWGASNLFVLRSADAFLVETPAASPARFVAIVPGARVYRDGSPSPVLEDRLQCALELYRLGRVRRVLVSGDHGRAAYDESNSMRRWLLARGVAAADVFTDHAGFRTLDTMQRASSVFSVRDAVVCTQRFHLARSVFLARSSGIDAVGVASDRRVYLHRRRDALRETVSRFAAVLDIYLLRTRPRFGGPPIPIQGDVAPSLDEHALLDSDRVRPASPVPGRGRT